MNGLEQSQIVHSRARYACRLNATVTDFINRPYAKPAKMQANGLEQSQNLGSCARYKTREQCVNGLEQSQMLGGRARYARRLNATITDFMDRPLRNLQADGLKQS